MHLPGKPTQKNLFQLGRHTGSVCVSIYMNLPEERGTTAAYRARLRHLVRAADKQTPWASDPLSTIRAVEEFAQEPNLWLTNAGGLALFATSDALNTFYVDEHVHDLATVGDRYHIKPLLEGRSAAAPISVVALTVDGAQLYHVANGRCRALGELELAKRMSLSKRSAGVQFRTQTTGGVKGGALFHGHGAIADMKQKEMGKRLGVIDEWLCRQDDVGSSIILAGVPYLTSAFRSTSRYRGRILHETIDGGRLTETDIASRAQKIMMSDRRDVFEKAKHRCLELAATPRVLRRYDQILDAAINGLVETAFVAADRDQWQSGSRMGLREDVFDRIASETYVADGEIFVVPEAQVPLDDGACAILRY